MVLDPATMAAISGGISAAGNVAGGFLGSLGGISQGDMIIPSFNAAGDIGLAGQQFDALNQIGFGNVAQVPGPLEQLVNRISGLSIDEKTKRRALGALREMADNKSVRNPGRLTQALTRLGLNESDVNDILAQDAQFRQQRNSLAERLGVMNQDTVLNRAKAAAAASQLLGEAGQYATGGQPSNFQQSILNRLNRNIDDQEQAYLLRAQYGGFNPAFGIEQFQRARQDSELTALTQAVQAATALTGGLSGGLQAAQAGAGMSSGASMNALQIAAQQAQAANALAQQSSINKYDSLANGVAGGANALAGGFMSAGLLSQPKPAAPATAGVGTERGFSGFSTPSWQQLMGYA